MSQIPGTISPYMTGAAIQGNTNFGAAGAGANLFQGANQIVSNPSGAISSLANNYANQYNSALGLNQQQYSDVLKGYQGTMASQVTGQQAIAGGYNQLYNTVLGTLGLTKNGTPTGTWGVAAPAAQAIADTEKQQQGAALQNAANTGIGGTSALTSLERGAGYDAQKAYGALGANLAQTGAGYESSLGQAGLNYANQANMQNTALANEQLKFMGGVSIPYPSASGIGSMISGAAGIQAAQAAAGRGAAANRGAVVNPFGGADAGTSSLGHTPFISGSAGSPQVMSMPQATGQALGGGGGGTRPPNPQTLNLGTAGAAGVAGSIAAGLGIGANSAVAGAGGLGLAAQYLANQANASSGGLGAAEQQGLQYTTDSQGNPQLQDSQGNYYDPSTGEWIGSSAFDSSGGFSGGGGGE